MPATGTRDLDLLFRNLPESDQQSRPYFRLHWLCWSALFESVAAEHLVGTVGFPAAEYLAQAATAEALASSSEPFFAPQL